MHMSLAVNHDQAKPSMVTSFLFPMKALRVGLILANVWWGKVCSEFGGNFSHSLRLKEETNSPFLTLDDVSSGYNGWNYSCHLLTMRSSGLRTKPVSKNGRAGRWKEPGPLMTSVDHKTDQPYKCLHLRTSGHMREHNLLCLKQLSWVFWSWQLKA